MRVFENMIVNLITTVYIFLWGDLFSFFFSDRARIMSGNRRIGRKRVRIVK
jgi:hypothetical protein